MFKINVLLNFLVLKKIYILLFFTKICIITTVFHNNNNDKFFLSSKSAYYYDFWRSCDTEDWSNDAENTDYFSKYIQTETSYFKL